MPVAQERLRHHLRRKIQAHNNKAAARVRVRGTVPMARLMKRLFCHCMDQAKVRTASTRAAPIAMATAAREGRVERRKDQAPNISRGTCRKPLVSMSRSAAVRNGL